jgi:hypothetical protein
MDFLLLQIIKPLWLGQRQAWAPKCLDSFDELFGLSARILTYLV